MDQKLAKIKRLFLIDGLGALVSAIMLGVVLVKFQPYFGIPVSTLYFLAFLPCLFALFDLYSYLRINEKSAQYLKGIAFVNLGYCCLSLALAFYHSQEITTLGWIYVIGEVIIVLVIAMIELQIASE